MQLATFCLSGALNVDMAHKFLGKFFSPLRKRKTEFVWTANVIKLGAFAT
jgi:hypothetical protein